MPCLFDGTEGVLVAVSTPECSCMESEHKRYNEAGMRIDRPSWLKYQVYWFRGLAFLNWRGMTNPAHNGTYIGYLEHVLDRICVSIGMPLWRSEFCHVWHGQYRQGLRNLLPRLGIVNWCEITSGLSWRAYRALDVYVRVFSNNMPPPTVEAHYLLNNDRPVFQRYAPNAEDWWEFAVWESIGQSEVVSEWAVRDLRFQMVPVARL